MFAYLLGGEAVHRAVIYPPIIESLLSSSYLQDDLKSIPKSQVVPIQPSMFDIRFRLIKMGRINYSSWYMKAPASILPPTLGA
jgi:hypothetical protein